MPFTTFTNLIRHLDAAKAEAAEFDAAGCFGLARCRRRDVIWLRGQIEALDIFGWGVPAIAGAVHALENV